MIQFDLPQEQSSIIKVIGIGGGGGNAVNHMFNQHIEGVNFIICNTDAQALAHSKIANKIQLGPLLTSGLGAGANPEIGRQATEESLEEVRKILEVNTKMVFITAGMGGGTGTGGAPIIAKICKDLGVLTVGIITTPFAYEGKKRQLQAEEGIKQLKQYVDTLLIISNDKLRHQFGNLKMREAFEKADNVLATAAKCITDVINSTGQINVDFADVCTVMKNGGVAILGNGTASGENRAQQAIEEALNSPLLNDNDIKGAKWILININSAEGDFEHTMDEVEIIQSHLLTQAGENTDVILGMGYDNSLGENIGITIIATGFENKNMYVKPVLKKEEPQEDKIFMTLQTDHTQPAIHQIPKSLPPVSEQPISGSPEEISTLEPILIEEPLVMNAPMPTITDFNDFESGLEIADIHYLLGNEEAAENTQKENELEQEKSASAFHSSAIPSEDRKIPQPIIKETVSENIVTVRSFLSKPTNLYSSEKREEKMIESEADGVPAEENEQMELFEKKEIIEEHTTVSFTAQTTIVNTSDSSNPKDDIETQRLKQQERLQKLRNLSFNSNINDPNNEFETVPAYIRRNMELYNNSSHIESYYSKLEVTSDDKNQGQINTINTFLDGKKPD